VIRIAENRTHYQTRLLNLFWLGSAFALGWVIASQPTVVSILILLLAVGLVAISVNPIAGLVILLTIAPLRTLIATESPIQLPLDIGQIALGVILIFFLGHQLVRGKQSQYIRLTSIHFTLLLFIAVAASSVITATNLTAWMTETAKWVQIVLMIVLAQYLCHQSSNGKSWLIFSLTVSGVANALIGIYQFFGGSGALHLLINDRFFRAFGTFGQPNPFAGFMGILIPVTAVMSLSYGIASWKSRRPFLSNHLLLAVFYLGCLSLLTLGIVMSWSRGAWLGMACAIAMMIILLPKRLWIGFSVFGAVALIFTGLWITGVLPASVTQRITSSTEEFFAFQDVRGIDITPENYAVAERLAHWTAAINMTLKSPWLGIGFGNYESAYPAHRLINWIEPLGHAHNYYLNILAEIGIFGLLKYLALFAMLIFQCIASRRHPDVQARLLSIGLTGTWVYLSVHSIFDNLYVNNLFLHIGLLMGLSIYLHSQVVDKIKVQDQ
jgi:putative inorganic carbon (hco3(-)) transporter